MSVPDPASPPAPNGCPSVDSHSGLPCNRERGHDGEHRAEARYGWTDPIHFSPPPAWAVEMANALTLDYTESASERRRMDLPRDVGPEGLWCEMLARLLASVREGALREAAGEAGALAAVAPRYASEVAYNQGAADAERAILSLLTTPPREATR